MPSKSSGNCNISETNTSSSHDSAIQADSVLTSDSSPSPHGNHGNRDFGSPTASYLSSKSPRKTPRKCKLAVNFSVPMNG